MVEPLGIEPSPDALQASARTLYAKVPDTGKATPKCSLGFELVGLTDRLSYPWGSRCCSCHQKSHLTH
ncbi:hypothetical protein XBJ2_500040 [Xenorhabdus bovienii str. Jollieti]|nr:hypothetical protein XBJ2_500040 [Xenorhabdus bovienii str. Jollieti]